MGHNNKPSEYMDAQIVGNFKISEKEHFVIAQSVRSA